MTVSEPKISRIMIDEIETDMDTRLRPVSDAGVASLMASITEIGVIKDPIHLRKIRRDGDERLVLMAGAHRLEAARRLGWLEIPARIWTDVTNDFARMIEIDDNLAGAELSPLELAVFLAERKLVYERLHPEAKAGGPRGNQFTGGRQTDIMSFCQSVAEKRDLTPRHIRRFIMIGSRLSREDVAVLSANKAPLKDLMSFAKLREPAQRAAAIALLSDGAAPSLGAAVDTAKNEGVMRPILDLNDQAYVRLMKAWASAPKKAKDRFIEDIRAQIEAL